jgi:hypothetical protein
MLTEGAPCSPFGLLEQPLAFHGSTLLFLHGSRSSVNGDCVAVGLGSPL